MTPQATTKSTQPSSGVALRRGLRDILLEFLPPPFKSILNRGLGKMLLLSMLAVFVGPPLIVLAAAFLFGYLRHLQAPLIRAARTAYLEQIYEGFSIDEFSSRSNVRLDYYQVLEVELGIKKLSRVEIPISIQRGQKVAIDFRIVKLMPDSRGCSLTEDSLDLVSVSLDNHSIRTLGELDSGITAEISEKWWKAYEVDIEDGTPVGPLLFSTTEQAKNLRCGKIRVEAAIRVFKDIVSERTAGVGGRA